MQNFSYENEFDLRQNDLEGKTHFQKNHFSHFIVADSHFEEKFCLNLCNFEYEMNTS